MAVLTSLHLMSVCLVGLSILEHSRIAASPKCFPIFAKWCRVALGYRWTDKSALNDMHSKKTMGIHQPHFGSGCSPHYAFYACSRIYPRCSPTAGVFHQKPCRRLCEEVRRDCGALLRSEDREWAFRCEQLPTDRSCLLPANYTSKPFLPVLPLNKTRRQSVTEEFQAIASDSPLPDEWSRFPKCKENSQPVEQVRKHLRTLLYQFDKPCQLALISEFLDEINARHLLRNNSSLIEKKMGKMTKLLETLASDVKRLKADTHARHVVRSIQSLLMKKAEV